MSYSVQIRVYYSDGQLTRSPVVTVTGERVPDDGLDLALSAPEVLKQLLRLPVREDSSES